MANKKNVILGITGSIAAYKACDLTRRLMEKNFEIVPIMTHNAAKFITPLTISSLVNGRVWYGNFEETENNLYITHVELTSKADVVVIAPATANIIGKIANGIADDLLTCIMLVTRKPIIIAPAMNEKMYLNEIVQENCRKLKKRGMIFVEPVEGLLACGVKGVGHLAPVEEIVKKIEEVCS